MKINRNFIKVTSVLFCCSLVAEIDAGSGPVDYFKVVSNGRVFVDKSFFIREFLSEDPHNPTVNVIVSPAKLGKSTIIDMLKRFLTIPMDIHGRQIPIESRVNPFFNYQIKISLNRSFVAQHMWQYPVIHIDYHLPKRINDFDSFLEHLKQVVKNTFQEHKYLGENKTLFVTAEDHSMLSRCFGSGTDVEPQNIEVAFSWLSQLLFKHFGRKVIVLVDEYDAFCREILFGKVDGEDKIITFLNNIHRSLLEHNSHVEKALLTGILWVKEVGVPSSSLIQVYHWLTQHRFAPFLGFTESEIFQLTTKNTDSYSSKWSVRHALKRYYNGYELQGTYSSMYNLWSVIHYFLLNMRPKTYWFDAGRFDVLEDILLGNEFCLEEMKQLITRGKYLTAELSRQLDKRDIINIKQRNMRKDEELERLIILLYQLGFLIPVYQRKSITTFLTHFTIPNTEILMSFCKMLTKHYIVKLNFNKNNIEYLQNAVDNFNPNVKVADYNYKAFYAGVHYLLTEPEHFLYTESEVHSLLTALLASKFPYVKSYVYTTKMPVSNYYGDCHRIILSNENRVAIFMEIILQKYGSEELEDYVIPRNVLANLALKRIYSKYQKNLQKPRVVMFKRSAFVFKTCVFVGLAYDIDTRNISMSFYNPDFDDGPTVISQPYFQAS